MDIRERRQKGSQVTIVRMHYRLPVIAMIVLGCSEPTPKPVPFALHGLSEVASVTVPLDPPQPQLTIIHLLDWHSIPPELYAAELRARTGRVTDKEADRRYRRFLDDVAAVKADQTAVLRHLIREGVRAVYQEGLTSGAVEIFGETARAVAAVERETLVDSIERAERLLDHPDPSDEARELHAFAVLALEQYDADKLTAGAVGEVLAEGILSEVRPLEDAESLIAADPRRADGTAVVSETGQRRRDELIVRRLLECPEPVAVVILGGSHQLDTPIWAGERRVRYIRVGTQAYEAAGCD